MQMFFYLNSRSGILHNMKKIIALFFITQTFVFAQNTIVAHSVDSILIKAEEIVGIDKFETLYYLKGAGLFKKQKDLPVVTYGNIQLGFPTTVNTFNPLKINIFYQDFNTVIGLDNRMTEIYKVDFNRRKPYLNVSHLSTGADNTIWIFNQDLQQLQIYDYKTDKIRSNAVPVQSNVLDLVSDYNYAWLLTEKYLYQYNYTGSLISKIENNSFEKLATHNENILIKVNDDLLYKPADKDILIPVEIDTIMVKQFLLNGETLYIYHLNKLLKYQLKIK